MLLLQLTDPLLLLLLSIRIDDAAGILLRAAAAAAAVRCCNQRLLIELLSSIAADRSTAVVLVLKGSIWSVDADADLELPYCRSIKTEYGWLDSLLLQSASTDSSRCCCLLLAGGTEAGVTISSNELLNYIAADLEL